MKNARQPIPDPSEMIRRRLELASHDGPQGFCAALGRDPKAGDKFYCTRQKRVVTFDGHEWVPVAGVPEHLRDHDKR